MTENGKEVSCLYLIFAWKRSANEEAATRARISTLKSLGREKIVKVEISLILFIFFTISTANNVFYFYLF